MPTEEETIIIRGPLSRALNYYLWETEIKLWYVLVVTHVAIGVIVHHFS